MAERKHTHGLGVSIRNGVTVISIGDMEIWDGADLSLIRDALHTMITREGNRQVGVDMRHVQYVPSGFFGMLFDWFDRGIQITLYHPRERVRNMLWFRQFFALQEPAGAFQLHGGLISTEEADDEPDPATDPVGHEDLVGSDDPMTTIAS